MKYTLSTIYTNEKEDNHSINESWSNVSLDVFKVKLAECLDLLVKDSVVVKPDIQTLERNLSSYCDSNFIENEFSRLDKYYNFYNEIMEVVNYNGAGSFSRILDDNTKVIVEMKS